MLTVEKMQQAARILDAHDDAGHDYFVDKNSLMQAIGNYRAHQQKWMVDLFSPKGLDIIFSRGKL